MRALVIGMVVLAAATITSLGLAAPPAIERIAVDETFHDEFLSGICGIDVHVHAVGHEMFRSSTGAGGKLIEVHTLNISLTATSAEGQYRLKDVGADVIRITKNGVVLQLIGQLPFWFNGIVWIDPNTGEIIKGPTGPDLFPSTVDAACSALNP